MALAASDVINLALAVKNLCENASAAKRTIRVLGKKMDTLAHVLCEIDAERVEGGSGSLFASGAARRVLDELRAEIAGTKDAVERAKRMNRAVYLIKAKGLQEDLEERTRRMQLSLAELEAVRGESIRRELAGLRRDWAERDAELRREAERERRDREEVRRMLREKNGVGLAGAVGIRDREDLEAALREMEAATEELRSDAEGAVEEIARAKADVERQALEQIVAALLLVEVGDGGGGGNSDESDVWPDWCLCPVTFEVMKDPVIVDAPCHHTVERSTNENWLGQGHATCPACGSTLRSRSSSPNVPLREAIQRLRADNSRPRGTAIRASGTLPSSSQKSTRDAAVSDDSSTHSFLTDLSVPLSQQVRSSAAAALIRGPPATRHFGGARGGLAKGVVGDRNEGQRFGIGSVAICGKEKTIIYTHDQIPPGKTYPVRASGAITSDLMDNDGSEYLCCFIAKDKRLVVFELCSKTVVVELQMTTKLNFWRYLPPQAHGHAVVFMLITPVGGFHWIPLEESPRPHQVWKRGPDLQGKKAIAYEEGGSNGLSGHNTRSTVALLLASSTETGVPVEAWCLPVCGNSRATCISSDVLGAALCRPSDVGDSSSPFLPLLVTAVKVSEPDIMLRVGPLTRDPATGAIGVGEVLTCAVLDQRQVTEHNFAEPSLVMGTSPAVICCCLDNTVIAIVRKKGLLAAYKFSDGNLTLVGQKHLGKYVVDAAVRDGEVDGEIDVVVLLCDTENLEDGYIATVNISRKVGFVDWATFG